MEVDLGMVGGAVVAPPVGYRTIPWREDLRAIHAEVKYLSFREEIDAMVFPCLGSYDGCLRLMDEISGKQRFLAEATWLIARERADRSLEYCGTIQGLRDPSGYGAIQNIGITPEHRGVGLGTVLISHSLAGFRQAGLPRAYLEVTAQNHRAIHLYERIGFRRARTAYKAVEVALS
jgi:hypothetical protein